MGTEILGPIVVFVLIPLYFVPAIVAGLKNHHNKVAIMVLNIFLGWTFLGWVAALIWSFTRPPQMKS